MISRIDENTTVIGVEGLISVTRPSIFGGVAIHIIHTVDYSGHEIANWLKQRLVRKAPMIQEAFPLLSDEDREFLLTGITPEEWKKRFPKRRLY
jgi:hypothetical protein